MTKLAVAMIRSKQVYSARVTEVPMVCLIQPISTRQHTAVDKILRHEVIGNNIDRLVVLVHRLLLAIATPPISNTHSMQRSIQSPVARYVLLKCVRLEADGSHSIGHVRYTTAPIAKLIYMIRGVILMEIGQALWQPQLTHRPAEELDER